MASPYQKNHSRLRQRISCSPPCVYGAACPNYCTSVSVEINSLIDRDIMAEQSSLRRGGIDHRILLITGVLTIGNLAICTHRSSRVYLYQQSLCLNYYRENNPAKIEDQTSIDESLCKIKDVQSPLSVIDGLDAFLVAIPGKVAHTHVFCCLRNSHRRFGTSMVLAPYDIYLECERCIISNRNYSSCCPCCLSEAAPRNWITSPATFEFVMHRSRCIFLDPFLYDGCLKNNFARMI